MGFLNAILDATSRGVTGGAEAVKAIAQGQIDKNLKLDIAKEMADIEMEKQLRIEEITGDRQLRRSKELSQFDEDLRTSSDDYALNLAAKEQTMDLERKGFDDQLKTSAVQRDAATEEIAAAKAKRKVDELNYQTAKKFDTEMTNYEKAILAGNTEQATRIMNRINARYNLANPNARAELVATLTKLVTAEQRIATDTDASTDARQAAREAVESYRNRIKGLLDPMGKNKNSGGLINGALPGGTLADEDIIKALKNTDLTLDGKKIDPSDYLRGSDGTFTAKRNPLRGLE